jgi:cyclopropane-fatty-acyl-phospholipid synthase
VIEFVRWRALYLVLRDGENGLAEAYVEGLWTSPDFDAFFAFGVANGAEVNERTRGFFLAELVNRVRHWRNANTKAGSRRNIAAHYDLGNDFYAAWLDAGMSYSSALYESGADTLEAAQEAKIRRALDLMRLEGGERVLEIGCGWGAVMQALVERHGATVTGLSLSTEQVAYARQRLGADGRAVPMLQDYRDVEGRFDRIVSIEMLEAVGERYWPLYFSRLRELLAEGGTAVLQVITISEGLFPSYRAKPDFIQRYIFPGGMLPTKTAIAEEARAAGLTLDHQEFFGLSYAETLAAWRRRFLAAWPKIEAMGFDERFRRLWLYYLAYCEAGFRAGSIDVGFYRLTR